MTDASDASGASGESSAAGSPGASETATESASDGASYASDKERIDAAVLALESGDLAAVKAALGRENLKLPEATAKAFTAISKREQKHRERVKAHEAKVSNDQAAVARAKHEISTESTKLSNARRELDQRYGWTQQTEKAWDAGDMVGVAKGIERLCRGASLATITQRIAGMSLGKGDGATGETQAIVEGRKKLDEERAAWERKQEEERLAREKAQSQRTHAEQRQAALSKFGEQNAKHPYLANPDDPSSADPEARDEAFAVYEQAWQAWQDGKLPSKPSAKKILDELHQQQLRRLKRLGITPAAGRTAATAPKAGTSNGKTPPLPQKRLPEPPPTNAKPPSREDTRASRIALARKITEQQMRGVRV